MSNWKEISYEEYLQIVNTADDQLGVGQGVYWYKAGEPIARVDSGSCYKYVS